jgi:uncharacterized membrane protein
MSIRGLVLWVHVLCGVVWIGASAAFILASAASTSEPSESSALIIRTAPQINRLCLPLAVAIPATGIANLFFAVRAHGSTLPAEFMGIIAAKLGLLALMVWALMTAWHATQRLERHGLTGPSETAAKVYARRILASYGVIVGAGMVALGLGLWLSGI